RGGRVQGAAGCVPRGGPGPGRPPLAAGEPGAAAGGQERPAGRGAAGGGAGRGRDHGGADGHRARGQHSPQPLRSGAHPDRHHRRRAGRGLGRLRPLPGAVHHRHPAVRDHLHRQPDRRPGGEGDPQAMSRFTETPIGRRKRRFELVAKGIFGLMALAMVVPLVCIVVYLVVRAWPLLPWDFLTSNPTGGMRHGGIWSALLGTIYLVGLSLFISAPIGVLAAVYLNEYARDNWYTRIINLAVVNLAGVPSIVHALFGLGAFVLFAGIGRSILAAWLALSILTLPVIIASTKEALAAVPMAFREACWNVGATRWQTIRRIVLP